MVDIAAALALPPDEVRAALESNLVRFCNLLRSAPDRAVAVPGLTWTVGEIGAHFVTAGRLWARMLAGEASPIISLADASTNTARMLAEFDERDPTILADLMMVENRALIEEVSSRPPDEPYPWHAGLQLTMTQASAVALGEFLVHGFDLARALRRPWSIEGRHALLVINGIAAILPAAVDPTRAEGFTASYELRLRGGAPFGMRFDHGALSIQPGAARRADCHISAEPAAFLLVSYGRVTPWRYVARGRLVAWGRRPWLAPRFGKMLHSF